MMKLSLFLIALMMTPFVRSNTYIFVSHSMGEEALKSYYQEAKKHGATLVMRGLLEDSFQKTKAKAAELKIAYDINPPLFEEYGVTHVPVIVSNEHKMTGHVKLEYALEKFQEKPMKARDE